MNKNNYRKFYELKTGVKIPKNYDIHHIDLNRNNNDILNLVAIPRVIHHHFHNLLRFNNVNISIDLNKNPISYLYDLKNMIALGLISEFIHNLIIYRNSLLGFHFNYLGVNYDVSTDDILNNLKYYNVI